MPKKIDPISDKARALNNEIAALEAQIKKLDSEIARTPGPKYRSTALPPGHASLRNPERPAAPKPEPVFEEFKRGPLTPAVEGETPEVFNELGVRRYDLPALWHRIRNHFHGPSTRNPRLVSYLATGGVQGLRPLRYEKRVARNRVLALAAVLLAILCGIFWIIIRRH